MWECILNMDRDECEVLIVSFMLSKSPPDFSTGFQKPPVVSGEQAARRRPLRQTECKKTRVNICLHGLSVFEVKIDNQNNFCRSFSPFHAGLLRVSCRRLFLINTCRSWWMDWRPRCSVPTTPPSPCSSSSRSFPAVSGNTAASSTYKKRQLMSWDLI